jgi:hypothetical protein
MDNKMIDAWEFVYDNDTNSGTTNYKVGSLYFVRKPPGFSNYRFACPKMRTMLFVVDGMVAICVGTGYFKANPLEKHAVFLTTPDKSEIAIEIVIRDRAEQVLEWEKKYLFLVAI